MFCLIQKTMNALQAVIGSLTRTVTLVGTNGFNQQEAQKQCCCTVAFLMLNGNQQMKSASTTSMAIALIIERIISESYHMRKMLPIDMSFLQKQVFFGFQNRVIPFSLELGRMEYRSISVLFLLLRKQTRHCIFIRRQDYFPMKRDGEGQFFKKVYLVKCWLYFHRVRMLLRRLVYAWKIYAELQIIIVGESKLAVLFGNMQIHKGSDVFHEKPTYRAIPCAGQAQGQCQFGTVLFLWNQRLRKTSQRHHGDPAFYGLRLCPGYIGDGCQPAVGCI